MASTPRSAEASTSLTGRRPPRGHPTWASYYRYRIDRGAARGLTRSQSRGHPGKGQSAASQIERDVMIIGRTGPIVVTVIGVRELSRAGRYDNDVQELLSGKVTPRAFDQRWKGRSIGGNVLPSWQEIVLLGHQGLASFDDFYPRRS